MNQIPCFDFTQDPHSLEQGREAWKDLCNQVREACEQYGSFQVIYNQIPSKLCQDVFKECKPLFDLPQETKVKNTSSRPYIDDYLGSSDLDKYGNFEGFGIADSPMLEPVQAFADIMWPNGNPSFCEAVHSISKHFHDLEMIVMKMLCDAYGVAKHFKAQEESTQDLFRVHKYKIPQQSESPVVLGEHTDKGNVTIICQDEKGLEVLSRKGVWCEVAPSKAAFIVLISESLKAWSNGRLYAPIHRVTLGGQKERYSYTLFGSPKEGVIVDVPEDFIDKEHPRAYKPYNFMSFMEYLYTNEGNHNGSMEVYAGV